MVIKAKTMPKAGGLKGMQNSALKAARKASSITNRVASLYDKSAGQNTKYKVYTSTGGSRTRNALGSLVGKAMRNENKAVKRYTNIGGNANRVYSGKRFK